MKKVYVTLVFLIFLLACTENKENTNLDVEISDIVGEWELVEFLLDGNYTDETLDLPINTEISAVGSDYDFTITFTNNPKDVTAIGSFNSTVTYSSLGSTTSELIVIDTNDKQETGTWNLIGEVLEVIPSSQTDINLEGDFKIIEFNDEVMQLQMDIDQIFEGNDQDEAFKISAKGTTYLKLKKKI